VAAGCLLLGSTGGALAGSMITGKQIKDGSLTGKDIKDKSLTSKDLSPAATAALTGSPGAPGVAGKNAYQFVDSAQALVPAGTTKTLGVACPAGTVSLGANVRVVSGTISTIGGGPTDTLTWEVTVGDPTVTDATVVPYAICTRP
jgi:hypothetical protein